jgi:N-succinyl-L-ornithine transcarbamylase
MKFMPADFTIACPSAVQLNEEFIGDALITDNQRNALQDADIVYVKSWCSYEEYGKLHNDSSWLLTRDKLAVTNNAKVMHCLPVRRDVELGSDILESSSSAVIAQAANRVPAAQAVLLALLKDNFSKPVHSAASQTVQTV